MKKIILFVLLFAALKVAGQTTGYLRFDTVKIMKQNGTCELYIINKTKDSLGILTNVGGGLTQFRRSRVINDSMLIVGLDTLTIRGNSTGGTSTTLNNIGTGYALVATPSGNIKRLNNNYGILIDSTTTANTITIRADTSSDNHLVTQSDLNDAVAAGGSVQSEFSITGDGTSGDKLKLVNDASTPGNNKIYGTGYTGTKGYVDPDVAWYNLVKAGADNTGASDISTYLTAAMAAGQRYIYLPRGTYLISSMVQMLDSVTVKGDGRQNTIIKLTSNITAFNLTDALGGKKSQLLDFSFLGNSGTTSQRGIYCDSITGVYIHNVGAKSLGGFFATFKNNGLLTGSDYVYGNIVSDCYGEGNYGGVYFDVRGEYNTVQGCSFNDGTYGVRIAGGNNRVIGSNFSLNAYNIYLEAGSNDGHGTAVGNTFNHALTYNVYANGLLNGFDFTGNMIYGGNMALLNSDFIGFHGGDIAVTGITVTNCTHTNFDGVKWILEPSWSVTGNSPGVFKHGEASTQGFVIRDPDANSDFKISNNNGLASIGDASVDRIELRNSLVGKTGSIDNSRDLCMGRSRFDMGSTSGDGVQFYKTGSTDATVAIISNAGNYMFYAHPNGRTGIGNNGSPTAQLHIAAGTATANTAPLKLTAGTNLTTPEAGAVEFDGTHFYGTVGSTRYQLDQQGSATTIYTGDGTLGANRTVSTGGNTLTVSGSNDNETTFTVSNTGTTSASAIIGTATGTTSVGVTGTSSQYIGVYGSSTSNTGIQGESSSGVGVIGVSSTGAGLRAQINPSSNNAVENTVTILRTSSSGAGANGLGAAIQYELETATNGTSQVAGRTGFEWSDATNATRTSQFVIYGVNSATTARKAALAGSGQWTWDGYGSGTHMGTPTQSLQVTSAGAVIEGPLVAAGTYTPTLTGVTNVTGTTAYACQYMRVGNTVTVSGKINIDFTATGLTEVGISLPIASNIANNEECAGTIATGENTISGAILGDATNNRAHVALQTASSAGYNFYFTFTYQVL